ncbi:MAG: hypothetical protein DRG25_00500 [Deltaproteobacteria bacterium]|nr:MAG: hypothetical protein DRG25_00500 [Deltaproteobacteria bacterium]RLF97660.1 MAG: hypothetical protein DRN47_06725 [Candidatus Wolframiiraptor sp.]
MKNTFLAEMKQEKGAVLITTLLIMIIMSLLGAAAIMTSSVDIKSSRQDRLKKSAFYAADAGVEIVPSIIDYYIKTLPDPAGFSDNLRSDLQEIVQDQYFLNEIMGYEENNDGSTDNPDNNPDLQITVDERQVKIDVDRIYTEHAGGGSAEALAGYEGTGTSGFGGIAIYYRATSKGKAASNTTSNVEIVYRYIY